MTTVSWYQHKVNVRNLFYAILVLFISSSALRADVIKFGSLQANSDGVNVTLRWITEDESNVSHFEIERRSGTDGEFVTIGSIDVKGVSLYEFIDNTAFKKVVTLYQYRVKIVYSNGTVAYSNNLTVTHTVSGVRRTWGSIKSMFR
jgi:hypothetical protein